jgi:hypothetical protein
MEAARKRSEKTTDPETRTNALATARAAADIAAGDAAAAEGAKTLTAHAAAELSKHQDRVDKLDEAARAAETAADNPPARVPASLLTCLLAHLMHTLTLGELDDNGKAMVGLQAARRGHLRGTARPPAVRPARDRMRACAGGGRQGQGLRP